MSYQVQKEAQDTANVQNVFHLNNTNKDIAKKNEQ